MDHTFKYGNKFEILRKYKLLNKEYNSLYPKIKLENYHACILKVTKYIKEKRQDTGLTIYYKI